MEIITASQIDAMSSKRDKSRSGGIRPSGRSESSSPTKSQMSLQFASLGLTQDPQIQDIVSQMNAMNAVNAANAKLKKSKGRHSARNGQKK